MLRAIPSTPDDHFTAGPHPRVLESAIGRIGCGGGCPTVLARIVTPASMQKIQVIPSTPDDHLMAGPDCRMIASDRGRAGSGGRGPTVGARIVPPAGVQKGRANTAAPDDHFTARPHCRVARPGTGRVRGAGGCPRILAACGTIRYWRKRVANIRRSRAIQSSVFRGGFPRSRSRLQFAMGPFVVHIEICYQSLRENRPSQTLRDNKGIVR